MDRSEIIVRMTSALKVVTVKRMMWNQVHQGMMVSLFHCEVCKVHGASVFSGSRIDGSNGFAIPRVYDTYR